MKKNGFAISGILYPMLILFLCFILLIMGNLAESHYRLRRLTSDIMTEVNGEDEKSQFKRRVENLLKAGNSCINYGVKEGKIRPSFSYGEDINDLTGRFYTMADGRTAALIDDGKYCAYKLTNYQSLRVQESGTCETSILSSDCTGAGLVCPKDTNGRLPIEVATQLPATGDDQDLVLISDVSLSENYPYFISATEPVDKEEGTLWIVLDLTLGKTLRFPYMDLPVVETKQYISGKWEVRHLYLYRDQEWKPLFRFESSYAYTGSVQTFTAPVDGVYHLEAWGSKGGNNGGNGAYAAGDLALKKGDTLYIYVGNRPTYLTSNCDAGSPTFNGSLRGSCTGGGGSTDFRLVSGEWSNETSLRSRILVAGAGGGGYYGGSGGYGGALTGGSSNNGVAGGTQTSGGGFGIAQVATSISGNGYYSGYGGSAKNAGGGSSYISGYPGCIAVTSASDTTPKVTVYSKIEDSYHYSGYIFKNPVMIAGNASMPNPNGGTMTGNSGNGSAKVTLIVD